MDWIAILGKMMLDKNNSPAWRRIQGILNIGKKAANAMNSAKNKNAQQIEAEEQGVE